MSGIEIIDMKDGDGLDVLTIDSLGLSNLISDNSLDSILMDGQLKLVIEGDVGDQFNLDSNAIHGMAEGDLVGGWSAPNGTAEIAYFPGNSTAYLKLTNGAIDLYIHEDVANLV
jgi:hypothetical protein